jgi:hypothetical protein
MKLIKAPRRTLGDGKPMPKEELLPDIKFHKHKFNNRPRPTDKNKILFITCFSEFGVESIGLMYCIPKILQQASGMYVICLGWYGRQYLYRHLVDEYWELDEQHQWLREYVTAFTTSSKNLKKLEKELEKFGVVYQGCLMGRICLMNVCANCKHLFASEDMNQNCEKCGSDNIQRPLLSNVAFHKKFQVQIPRPSIKKSILAKQYLKPNSVGIFARGRAMYGRNLSPEFYVNLIKILEDLGYNPIWLGEKQSVQPCPVSHITDFSRLPEARDLELTLAIISQLQFTVQFWTASTRLAAMVGTPFILVETPDQIVGRGQEGKRIALTSEFNKKKLILSQFHNVVENQEKGLQLVKQAVEEMNEDNWDDIIGLVDQPEILKGMLKKQEMWK